MSSEKKLSLCVVVKNGERTLQRLLNSLLPQAEQEQIQVAVVDHGSSDQTQQILNEFQRKHPTVLRVMNFQTPGLGAIRNFAWQSMQTEWVGFLDADCEPAKDWVATALDLIRSSESHTKIAAFGGSNQTPPATFFYRCADCMLSSWIGGHGSTLNTTLSESVAVDHLPTLNILYRRKALESVSGFDLGFLRVGEDLDLSFRLCQQGWQLWYVPRLQNKHWFRDNLGSWLKNMDVYGMGRQLFIQVHPSSAKIKFYLPLVILGLWIFSFGAVAVIHALAVFLGLWASSRARATSFSVLLTAVLLTVLTHLFFGFGFFTQLLQNRLKYPFQKGDSN